MSDNHCCQVSIGSTSRRGMLVYFLVTNILFILFGAFLVFTGIEAYLIFRSLRIIIADYNESFLPLLTTCVGASLLGLAVALANIIYSIQEPIDWHKTLGIISILSWVEYAVCCGILTLAICLLVDGMSIAQTIMDGFGHSMHQYASVGKVKVVIDELQLGYDCCGADNFTDWSRVAWFPGPDKRYFRPPTNRSLSVPFSCCNSRVLGPCLFGEMTRRAATETIHQLGCGRQIPRYVRRRLVGLAAAFTWLVLLLKIIYLITLRLWLTSTRDALKRGDPLDIPGAGYIFPKMKLLRNAVKDNEKSGGM